MKKEKEDFLACLVLSTGRLNKKSFFNFEQNQIFDRLKKALFLQDLGGVIYDDPDLYNPLWINVTLCFNFIIFSNLSKYLEIENKSDWVFDFSLVQKSFIMIFGFAVIIPILFFVFFYLFGFPVSFKTGIGVIAIYSYSNIFFIIGVFLTILPWKLFDYIIMGLSAFLTLLFLNLNYSRFINQFPQKKAKFILIFITLFQLFALFAYIMAFYY